MFDGLHGRFISGGSISGSPISGFTLSPTEFSLDFSAARGAIPAETSFLRASGARFIDGAGNLVQVGANVARFAPAGLALEGAGTNLMTRPWLPGGLGWSPLGIAYSRTTGPDTIADSASRWTETGGTDRREALAPAPGLTSGLPYIASFVCRAADATRFVQISTAGVLPTSGHANFDLLSGTVALASGVTAFISPVGGGWFVVSIRQTAVSSGDGSVRLSIVETGTAARIAPTTSAGRAVDVYAAQVEQSVFPTTFILPLFNATGPVTREADLWSAPLSALRIPESGPCAVLWRGRFDTATGAGTQTICALDNNTLDNRLDMRVAANGVPSIARVRPGVAFGTVTAGATPITVGSDIVGGLGLGSEGRVVGVFRGFNGGAPIELLNGPIGGLTTMRFGHSAGGIQSMFGAVSRIQVIPRAVSDAELQARVANF